MSDNRMSVSITVHSPDVEDVHYFPGKDGGYNAFSRVRCSGKGMDVTLMIGSPAEAYEIAEAITKAGDMLSIAGSEERKWTPRSKREGK